jgi:signal transduction histidine kinase
MTMTALATETPHAHSLGPEDLRQLMRSVNDAAERLHATHEALTGEVARLRGELEQANAQLRRSRTLAALGEMAAGIAHEVRNPLASIRLYAQVLAEEVAGHAQPARLCASIAQAIDRIEGVVRDVLRFARDTAPQREPVTAAELFAGALESSAAVLAGVTVENRAAQGPALALEADAGLMVQALGNVVRNAAEAMEESGAPERRLVLAALRQRRRIPGGATVPRIVLSVQDTGPGIAPEVLARMFNPFFTTRRAGTGLGLAIVHRIVEAHGGHVSVANRPEGGTTVELCLPGRLPAGPPGPRSAMTATAMAGRKAGCRRP